MTQVTKTIQVPATTKKVIDFTQCELCLKTTKNAENWDSKSSYDIAETIITLREGRSFPEGGSIESIIFDICTDCFKTKLMPWFVTQGAQARVEKTEW